MRFRPTNTPMPWSTWTTRSPTFRSRKSERKVAAAERRRSWTLRSSSKTSVSAQSWRPASGSLKPLRQVPGPDQHAGPVGILGAFNRHREDVVVGEHLDGPFGAAGGVGDEQDGVAALAPAANLRRPVLHAAVELHRRLAGDVARRQAGIVSGDLQGLEESRAFEPAPRVLPLHDQLRRRRRRHTLAPPLLRSWRRSAASACSPWAFTSSGSETRTIGRWPLHR